MKLHNISQYPIVALLLFSISAHAVPAAKRVVLPDAVTPEHYRIDFTPDSAALTFKSALEIDVVVHRATNSIVVNAADLVIDSAMLTGESKAPSVSYDKKHPDRDLHLRSPAQDRRAHAQARLSRDYLPERRRPVRARLQGSQGQAAGAVHAVRELRRAPLRALLGRAGREGDLRSLRHAARRCHAALQHAGRRHREAAGWTPARALRPVAEDVHLPAVLRRGRLRARAPHGGRSRRRHRGEARRYGQRRLRARCGRRRCCPTTTTTSACPIPCRSSTSSPGPDPASSSSAMENWGAIFYFEQCPADRPAPLHARRTSSASTS